MRLRGRCLHVPAQLAEGEGRLAAQQALFDAARAEANRNRQNLLAAQDELAQLRTRIRGLVRRPWTRSCNPAVSRPAVAGKTGQAGCLLNLLT